MSTLQEIYEGLAKIRTYLIKIGSARRKGECLDKKLKEANEIHDQLPKVISQINKDLDKYSADEVEEFRDLKRKIIKKYLKILELGPGVNESEGDVAETVTETQLSVEPKILSKMTLTLPEFFNLADKLLPKSFAGDIAELTSFIDSLELLKTNCGTHADSALNFVKTRLTGKARLAITDDITTLDAVIQVLKAKCKGEKSSVVEAKLLNVKQNGKDASAFTKQIDDLASSLLTAYLSEGIPSGTAESFVKNKVVKVLASNGRSDRTKLIMEAGSFDTVQDAIAKFVTVDTDSTPANVLYARRNARYFGDNNNSRRGNFNNRGNNNNNNNYAYRGNSNGQRQYNNNYQRQGQRNGRSNFHNNRGRNQNNTAGQNFRANVRAFDSENPTAPHLAGMGENL